MPNLSVLSLFVILILCFSVFASVIPGFAQQSNGPYIDEARFIQREQENIALEEVKAGTLDMYFFRIPLEAADDAKKDPRIRVYERNAGSMGLFVNPVPSAETTSFNPFESREIRHALNFLIDRDLVVQDILRGYGSPMYDAFGTYSPEYLNILDVVESFGFRYNPAFADSVITREMIKLGATKTDGKWIFGGNPVNIIIVIRQDDAPRKSLGELVASELEKLGFTVQRDYGDLSKANSVVYGSDPRELKWQLYTEGFAGTSVFVKYNGIVPAQMYAPWFGRMPGAGNEEFWSYKNTTLDDITSKIYYNFTSEQERIDLVRSAVNMGLQESVRLFVAQKTDPFVASADVNGLVNDFGAGITSKYSLVNAQEASGDKSLDIGVKAIHQGSWNLVAGLQDVYSRDIRTHIADSGTYHHPYTGEIIPMRGEWTDVVTNGPFERMDVSNNAIVWDPQSQQWTNVTDTQSKSRVTFKPLYSNWHHGIPMDISDFMYSDYFGYEWGTDTGGDDVTQDDEYTAQASVGLQFLKGVVYAQDEITNYVDYWHYDEGEIAEFGVFWPSEPWEFTAASERAVIDGKFAYSRSEATANGIGWYDPLIQEHTMVIRDEIIKMKEEGYIPKALRDVVTPEEAIRRYDAAIKWIDEHDHAIVSNGGFYLDNFNSAGNTITIKAFRDPTYPFAAGRWSIFQEPELADITSVDVPRSVTIGQPATVTVGLTVAGKPSSDAVVTYFISNRDGALVAKGEAESLSPGQFKFDLSSDQTGLLSAGPNQLKIFAMSNAAARIDLATNTIIGTTSAPSGPTQNGNNTPGTQQPDQQPSGCLIATAAFGSELSPQVQFLRNFREHYILSTSAGSAFMNTFNSVYYSFSPQVADYEREQPWLQNTVKAGLYPLFGILMASEKAHFGVGGGEAGAIASGTVAGGLIGAVYLWPAALSSGVQKRFRLTSRLLLIAISGSLALTVVGILAGSSQLLSISTPIFVVSLAATAAMTAGRLVRIALARMRTSRF